MRPDRWMLWLAGHLVPKALRADWRAEWEAELDHRDATLEQWSDPRHRRLDLIRRSTGAFWDALWLQSSSWHSLRLFGRHWRLALAAVLSLSVAIAAMMVGLAAYDALLLRPPGVGTPASLLFIHARTPTEPFASVSFDEYTAYRGRARAFADIAAFPYSVSSITFRTADRSEQVVASQVSDNFFPVLGVSPRLGLLTLRTSPADDEVVISEAFWRRLGSDPAVVGMTVRLNDHPVTIVGVTPASFGGMMLVWEPDVWMRIASARMVLGTVDPEHRWLHMVGRLKPGVSRSQALADMTLISSQIAQDHGLAGRDRSATLSPVRVTPPGDRGWVSMILGGLILVVLLTLIIACANVTNLLLGLATSRRHEMLVRAALGASRVQLVAPLLRESVLLGVAACAIGSSAACLVLVKLSAFRPPLGEFWPAPSINLRPDATVLVATLLIAVVAGLAIGLAPALRAASDGLSGAINRELSASEPRTARIRHILVVIQMAVATVVLIGVGVSIHSVINLRHVPLGFSARHLAFFGVDVQRSGFDERSGPAFYERVRQRVAALPGVEAATLADEPPLAGFPREQVLTEGAAPPLDGHGAETPYSIVDDSYFAALGIQVLAGRTFDSRDRSGASEVVVINETMARLRWPGRDPLGQQLRIENGNRLVRVIGVVPDGRYEEIDEPQLAFMYFALGQHYLSDITVIARIAAAVPAPDTLARALLAAEPAIAFGGIGTMTLDDLLELSLLLPRTLVATNLTFGILTLALAVLGVYSVVFYSVSQRRTEMGIRVALGAQPRDLFALVLRQIAWVALAGATLGMAAGAALLPLASSVFYGIGVVEPAVMAAVALTTVVVTLATTYAVARKWMGLSSVEMLRQ